MTGYRSWGPSFWGVLGPRARGPLQHAKLELKLLGIAEALEDSLTRLPGEPKTQPSYNVSPPSTCDEPRAPPARDVDCPP